MIVVLLGVAGFMMMGDDDDGDDVSTGSTVAATSTTEATDATTTTGATDTTDTTIDIDGTGAMSYGDNEDLDALYDDCADGDFAACDLLYKESDFGSEYEDFGDTCGERNEPSGYCVDLYPDGDG